MFSDRDIRWLSVVEATTYRPPFDYAQGSVTANQEITTADITNLVFTPTANASGAGADSFTFQVKDDGGVANGGVDTDAAANTLTFDITAVNDAPSFTTGANQTVSDSAGPQTVSGFITGISPGPADES